MALRGPLHLFAEPANVLLVPARTPAGRMLCAALWMLPSRHIPGATGPPPEPLGVEHAPQPGVCSALRFGCCPSGTFPELSTGPPPAPLGVKHAPPPGACSALSFGCCPAGTSPERSTGQPPAPLGAVYARKTPYRCR
eukprot:1193086-Rhodomonas_salina.1